MLCSLFVFQFSFNFLYVYTAKINESHVETIYSMQLLKYNASIYTMQLCTEAIYTYYIKDTVETSITATSVYYSYTCMQAPRSQMNSLCTCTKQLTPHHSYITAKMLFP